jgi:GxxExxY protein
MYNDLTYQINGCLFRVHNTLRNIWKEKVYEQALELELQKQGLQAERQNEFEVFYFEQRVGYYKIDILVEDIIIFELKAVPKVQPLHQAQLISYLKGYNKPVGILANFGEISLYHRTFPNKLEQKTPLKDSEEVRFLLIGDLLLSVVAVSVLDDLELSKFHSYIHYFKCKRCLIFNFNAMCLTYRYVEK